MNSAYVQNIFQACKNMKENETFETTTSLGPGAELLFRPKEGKLDTVSS